MEQHTYDFIQSLPLTEEQLQALLTTIEWEKELSWSDGYSTACDQVEGKETNPVTE